MTNLISLAETAAAPYRLYAELAGAAVLIAISIGWWVSHNHHEQSIGAQQCIQTTTVTKQEATIDVQAINAAHADQLQKVSDVLVAQLAAERAGAVSLAQRLHDADRALRARPLPGVPAPASDVCSAAVDAATRQLEAEHAPSFAACLANQDEVNAIRSAWVGLGKKKGAEAP